MLLHDYILKPLHQKLYIFYHYLIIAFVLYYLPLLTPLYKLQCFSLFTNLSFSIALYIEFLIIISSKSTLCPSKSGPSTQANFITPSMYKRQHPHIPVPSIIIGFIDTVVLILYSFVILQTFFIIISGPITNTSSYLLPSSTSFCKP